MKLYIQLIITKLICSVSYLLFPFTHVKKNKYLFVGMGGKTIGGNVKYYYDYVKHLDDGSELIWALSKKIKDKKLKYVKIHTLLYYYHFYTSKYIISDSRLSKYMYPLKKKGQIYVQTWHGTALKKIEAAADSLPEPYLRIAKNDSKYIDVFLSSSSFMTNIYKRDFWYHGSIYEIGTPRNDIFFNCDVNSVKRKVFEYLNIPLGKKIVLYAPTFRYSIDSFDVYDIDSSEVVNSLNKRFGGDFVFCTRLHPNIITTKNINKLKRCFPNSIDASFYGDIQELLLAADVLISDYSSCIFDYMLTNRPCFLYAKDYLSYDRGFYLDIMSLPFPFASDNAGLLNNIENFDENIYSRKIEIANEKYNTFENGTACSQLNWILKKIDINKH